MIKLILGLTLSIFSTSLLAASCFPAYQSKADEIQKDKAYTTHVGGSLYVYQGKLGYNPGLEVSGKVDNWARDFVDAVKWGPFTFTKDIDPRKEWLESFRKSIKKDCKLPKGNYDHLRAMLKDLMEDGSFCENNAILEPGFFKGKSDFTDVLKQAVKEQRFTQFCVDKAVADDSSREIKEVDSSSKKSSSKKSVNKQ